ncbi:MAG: hypothetical protein WC707_04760 [Candidatus Babeliaceae bacterium]|jgi:hypothetical protein
MLKKLVKHGDSHALVFDKSILELLNIKERHTIFKISMNGSSIILTPHFIPDVNNPGASFDRMKDEEDLFDYKVEKLSNDPSLSATTRNEFIKKAKYLKLKHKNAMYSDEHIREYFVLRDTLIPEMGHHPSEDFFTKEEIIECDYSAIDEHLQSITN